MVSQRGRNWFRSSRFRVSVTFLTAMVTVVAVTGAYRILSLPGTGSRVSIVSHPIELAISLDKTDFALGENMSIRFTLKNISNKPVEITMPMEIGDRGSPLPKEVGGGYMVFSYMILDENGTHILSRQHGAMALSTWVFTLEPLEEVSQTVIWNQQLRTFKDDKYHYTSVMEGTYSIKGTIPPEGSIHANGGPRITMETPAITFSVH